MSTPSYYDPNLPPPYLGWWIQTGLTRGSSSENPKSYVEWHDSAGTYHQHIYPTPQPQNYYRVYEVHRVGYRLWQAWIQGSPREQGYLPNDNSQWLQARAELFSQTGSVYTRHRNCVYQASPGSGWSWFNQARWVEQAPWDLIISCGTYDDFDEQYVKF